MHVCVRVCECVHSLSEVMIARSLLRQMPLLMYFVERPPREIEHLKFHSLNKLLTLGLPSSPADPLLTLDHLFLALLCLHSPRGTARKAEAGRGWGVGG